MHGAFPAEARDVARGALLALHRVAPGLPCHVAERVAGACVVATAWPELTWHCLGRGADAAMLLHGVSAAEEAL